MSTSTLSVPASSHNVLKLAMTAIDAKQGVNPVALNVSERFPFSEIFLIVTGNNERHVQAIAKELEKFLTEQSVQLLHREGREEGHWILLDFGELVVHVFHESQRTEYSLEKLWSDSKQIEIPLAS